MPTRMPTGVVRQKKRTMVTIDRSLNFACVRYKSVAGAS